MKFEDALKELREGKKITHQYLDGAHLEGCYIEIMSFYDDNGNLVEDSLEEQKKRGMSIVKVKDGRQSGEMSGKMYYVAQIKTQLKKILTEEEYKKYHNFYTEMDIAKIFSNDLFMFPQLNLLLVMSDDWEILE